MKKALLFAPVLIVLATGLVLAVMNLRHNRPLIRNTTTPNNATLNDFFLEAQRHTSAKFSEQARQSVTFLAVGDISLSRNIAATIAAKRNPKYPFSKLSTLLASTDFNFGNLETPFSSSDSYTAKNTLVFNAPKAYVAGLVANNFQVLNLANNHAFDQGIDGITTTLNTLDNNDLLHMGTGATLDQAWQPAIIEKNGIKIGFVGASYASINDGGKASNIYVARMEDTDRLKKTVGNLKSLVDFIVVTMHGGTEYTATANAGQITFAHAAIDSGADIVIGAHPHWVQNKETYKDKPIYYSLGNFIFDQSWSEQTKKGLVLKITLSKLGKTSINRTSAPANAASISDLQPTGNPSTPTSSATIDSIEEIPIHIEENCCPSLIEKEPKK